MNKSDFVSAVASTAELSKTDAGNAVDAVIEVIKKALKKGDSVSLVGFGSFEMVTSKARQGYNPATGDVFTIDATVRPKFSPGSNFKALVKETLEK